MVMLVLSQQIQKFIRKIIKITNLGGIKKYEHDIVGYNSRLDTVQAAILNNKLKSLNKNNQKRMRIANFYNLNIINKYIKKIDYSKVVSTINILF